MCPRQARLLPFRLALGLALPLLVAGCPSKDEAPSSPPGANKAAEAAPPTESPEAPTRAAAKAQAPDRPAAPTLAPGPLLPVKAEHLKNESWKKNAAPSAPAKIDREATSRSFAQAAQAGEAALTRACKAGTGQVLRVDPEHSKVGFVAYKNETVAVKGVFGEVHGFGVVGKTPSARLWIDTSSVDTGNPLRDSRLIRLLFEAEQPKLAALTFETRAIEGLPETLPEGDEATLDLMLDGQLEIHGVAQAVRLPLTLRRNGKGWRASASGPLTLQLRPFGLAERLVPLMAACNHKSIATAVEVRLDLALVPGCP